VQGPLLGSLTELDKKKPKLEGGLLGEMDKRAKEVEYLKKMGYYKASGFGPAGLLGLPHAQGESAIDTYNIEIHRQQLLMEERYKRII
jgi:abortive infection bacteriophage resistance protein